VIKLKVRLLIIAVILLFSIFTIAFFINKNINEPVVLNLGIFAGSNWDIPIQNSDKFFDETIASFEKLHPNIKVKYRSGTLKRDYSEWLAEKVITENEPDVFCILRNDFNTFVFTGILKDLDNNINKDPQFDKSKIFSNAIKSGQFQGRQYALPSEIVPAFIFVNRTLLKKEGINIPKSDWTWDDFYEICKKVTKDTDGDGIIDQFGTYDFTWQDAVYTNGQALFASDGSSAHFDSKGVLEAIQFLIKLNKLNMNIRATSKDFDTGKVAFRPFLFTSYKTYKPYPYRIQKYNQFEWECITFPKGPNGKNASELYSTLMGISSRTKHEKEAWEFLKFLVYNEETQTRILKECNSIPVLRNITESEFGDHELSSLSSDGNIINKSLISEVIEQSFVTPKFQKYEEAISMADKEIFQIVNLNDNPENALINFNKEINNFLK